MVEIWDWVALGVSGLVYLGFIVGAWRTGGLEGAAFLLAVTAGLFWLSLIA